MGYFIGPIQDQPFLRGSQKFVSIETTARKKVAFDSQSFGQHASVFSGTFFEKITHAKHAEAEKSHYLTLILKKFLLFFI